MKAKNLNDLLRKLNGPKKSEALEDISDTFFMIMADDEPLLFDKDYREALFAYIRLHSLHPNNQWLLLKAENIDVLAHFIKYHRLCANIEASLYSQKNQQSDDAKDSGLCLEANRYEIMKSYILKGRFACEQNERLLFNPAMTELLRLYIINYDFHDREAEKQLFKPEFAKELELYIACERKFFKEHIDLFVNSASDELWQRYQKYCAHM